MSRSVHASLHELGGSAAPAPRPAAKGEIRALTGLRIVAALWVVLTHFDGYLSETFASYLQPLTPILKTGWLGVDLFFLLSGFVLTLNYLDRIGPRFEFRATVSFLWARLARIWPLYAVLTTVMAGWLVLSGWRFPWPVEDRPELSVSGLLEQLALVQMWHRTDVPPSTYLAPGWSLSVEFLAYLSFPVLVLVLYRLRKAPVVLLGGLAVAVMVPLAVHGFVEGLSTDALPWPVRIAGAFVSGGLTCLVVQRIKGTPAADKWAPTVAVAAIAELLLVVYWTGGQLQAGAVDRSVIAVVTFPVLVGALALSDRGPAALLSREVLVLGGRISFALYLVHFLLLQMELWVVGQVPALGPGTPLGTLAEAQLIPLSLVVSYLLWRFVEEPGRRLMLRHGPGRARLRAATAPAARGAVARPTAARPAAAARSAAAAAQPAAAASPAAAVLRSLPDPRRAEWPASLVDAEPQTARLAAQGSHRPRPVVPQGPGAELPVPRADRRQPQTLAPAGHAGRPSSPA